MYQSNYNQEMQICEAYNDPNNNFNPTQMSFSTKHQFNFPMDSSMQNNTAFQNTNDFKPNKNPKFANDDQEMTYNNGEASTQSCTFSE